MRSIVRAAILAPLTLGAHELTVHNLSSATWIVQAADPATRTALTSTDQVSTLEVPGGESRRITLPGEGTFAFRLIDAYARSGLEVAWTLQPRNDAEPAVQTESRFSGEGPRPLGLVRLTEDGLGIMAVGYEAAQAQEALEPILRPALNGDFAFPDGDPSPESQASSPSGGALRRPRVRRARGLAHPYLTPVERNLLLEVLGLEEPRDNVEKKESKD